MEEAPTVDYEFYQDAYGGTLTVDAFSEYLHAARSQVAWFTCGHMPADVDAERYRRAVCAAIDTYAEHGIEGGFAIGDFRMTGHNGRGSGVAHAVNAAIERELYGSALIFAGVR